MISRDELDRQIPVSPPIVNRKMNPSVHSMEHVYLILAPWMVASHLNTLIPVGTAIIIVAAVKYARVSTSSPTVNMWWAHTMNPTTAIPIIA
jgi:hypothetical protein